MNSLPMMSPRRVEQARRCRVSARQIERRAFSRLQHEADLRMRHGKAAHRLGNGHVFGALGFHEFKPRRRRRKEIYAPRRSFPHSRPRASDGALFSAFHDDAQALAGVLRSSSALRAAIEPIEGSASPRKPSERMSNRSSSRSLLVACRSTLSARSSALMPEPSSVTRMSDSPPADGDDLDARRAGVDGVLDEFLDRARRALDHLARGDAVHGLGRELADRHDCSPSPHSSALGMGRGLG